MGTRFAHTDPEDSLPSAVLEDLLSNDSRRRALGILSARGESMVVEELAAAIVADRQSCPPSAVSSADREAMVEELFTDHLPKLTATGVVRYDSMLCAVELLHSDIAPQNRP